MRTLTLQQVKSTIARVAGICEDSPKIVLLVNEAQERILNRADKPVGKMVRYRICAGSSSCITWPRQVRTIEAFAVCDSPGTIRPEWFEFIGYPNGNGLQSAEGCSGNTLIDRGTACAFDDVQATAVAPRRIAVIADQAADAGKKVLLRYITDLGGRKYSSIDGVVQEGEELTLVNPGPAFPGNAAVTSSNVGTGGLYHVVKAVTDYPVYLYEYDPTVPVITKMLAAYEPSETVPIYRRSLVPGFTTMAANPGATEDCTSNKQITALVSLQHVPVVVDNDPLVIGNLAALKLMVMSILREEQNRHVESMILEGKARSELDGELSSYLGDGMMGALKVTGEFGAGRLCSA